jgi:hypothetical protein
MRTAVERRGREDMNLFFFVARAGRHEERLLAAMAPLVSRGSLEVFRGFHGFDERIRRPKDVFSAAVVFNPTREDLRKLAAARDYLKETKLFLVLPDEEEETIALAHRIFPTYITYLDADVTELVSVLRRLAEVQGEKTEIAGS